MGTKTITYAEVNDKLGGEQSLPIYHVNNGQVSAYIPVDYMSEEQLAQIEVRLQKNWETVVIYLVTGCPHDHTLRGGADAVGK